MSVPEPNAVHDWIEMKMYEAQRDLRRAVFPWEIQARLPFDRAEGTLRRDMAIMADTGRLVRMAGDDGRQGYRLPSRMERLAYQSNMGMWPHNAERHWFIARGNFLRERSDAILKAMLVIVPVADRDSDDDCRAILAELYDRGIVAFLSQVEGSKHESTPDAHRPSRARGQNDKPTQEIVAHE
jgi:hypothetical protein